MLKEMYDRGLMISYEEAYDESKLYQRLSEILEFLPDASEGFKQEVMEAAEYDETWEEF